MRVIALLLFCLVSTRVYAQDDYCKFDEENVVEIPITFKFAAREYQHDWAYRGLSPSVEIPNGPTLSTAEIERITEGHLETVFCVNERFLSKVDAPLVVRLGNRRLSAVPRPIQWRQQRGRTGNTDWIVRRGRMTPVRFENQAPPDWVIVRKAEWNVDVNGVPALELEAYNPSSVTHPGFTISFKASNKPRRLVATTAGRVLPVRVRRTGSGVQAVSGTPLFPGELVSREAHLETTASGEVIFETDLGPSAPIGPGDSMTLRYRFEPADGETKGKADTLYRFLEEGLPCRVVQTMGAGVYPTLQTVDFGSGSKSRCPA